MENPPLSSQYTEETANATRSAQELLGLPQTGIADAETWTAVEALSLQLGRPNTPNPDRDGVQGLAYPGRAFAEGSTGRMSRKLSSGSMAGACLYCGEDYVSENAVFGAAETRAVKAAQAGPGWNRRARSTGDLGRSAGPEPRCLRIGNGGMSTMARLLVYDAYENKVYTYANLREMNPCPTAPAHPRVPGVAGANRAAGCSGRRSRPWRPGT